MNLAQICSYLNEVGILDINNIKNYLSMTTNIINDNENNNRSNNDIYKISLFAYLRGINTNDRNLYLLCTNVINSYNRYILIKKYNYLHHFKKILYYKILQRFKYFTIALFKKFPFKNFNANRNYNNKKNNTCSNRFYKKNNNNNQNLIEINKKDNNSQNQKNVLLPKKDINYIINDYNANNKKKDNDNISLKSDNIPNINLFRSYYLCKELVPIKKAKKQNMDICISQSNINFGKYFINKKLVICKKCHPSHIEDIKNNKKELYVQNKPSLRKNKSETELRIKKMNYEENTRSKNFESIKPVLKMKIKQRAHTKRIEELCEKEKKDKYYNKLINKKTDENNIFDKLYTINMLEKMKGERMQEEKESLLNKNKKRPINWERVYLETNDKIINNKTNNYHKRNKTCSYFVPNKGRIYKYEENQEEKEEEKDNNNNNRNIINQNNKNKIIKNKNNKNQLNKKVNNKNKINKNDLNRNLNSNSNINSTKNIEEKSKESEFTKTYDIKESDLKYSINSQKEDKKEIKDNVDNINEIEEEKKEEKQEKQEKEEKSEKSHPRDSISNSNEDILELNKDIDKYKISVEGFKTKEIQALLSKHKNLTNDSKNDDDDKNEIKKPVRSSNESDIKDDNN